MIARTPNYSTYNGRKFTVPAIVEVSKSSTKAYKSKLRRNKHTLTLIHGGGSNPSTETRCPLELDFVQSKKICMNLFCHYLTWVLLNLKEYITNKNIMIQPNINEVSSVLIRL